MPPHSVAFRTATSSDVADIHALVRAAYSKWVGVIGREPRPMSVNYAEAINAFRFDVLMVEGRMAGIMQTTRRDDHVWIENIAVHPTQQGRGHGKSFLMLAEHLARHEKVERVRLLTNAAFTTNVALYQNFGYALERSEEFMGGSTLYMCKHLN